MKVTSWIMGKLKNKKPLKMYVLVRKDLDETYRNVQGGHALAGYLLKDETLYSNETIIAQEWNNGTLIHLGVRNVGALEYWDKKLSESNKTFYCWREPDMKDQLTAIACIDTGEIFKDLPLA